MMLSVIKLLPLALMATITVVHAQLPPTCEPFCWCIPDEGPECPGGIGDRTLPFLNSDQWENDSDMTKFLSYELESSSSTSSSTSSGDDSGLPTFTPEGC